MYLNKEQAIVGSVKVGFLISIITMSFIAALIVPFFVGKTSAVGSESVSWADSDPKVIKSDLITELASRNTACGYNAGSVSAVEVDGYLQPKNVCIMQGNDVRLGYSLDNYAETLVGFPNDSKMYKINLRGMFVNNFMYSTSQDTLIVKQQISGDAIKYSLLMYKNFSKKISRNWYNLSTIEYIYDNTQPDFSFPVSSMSPWYMSYWGMSQNGKYLAMELAGSNISLVNIETLEIKRVLDFSYNYYPGSPVTSQFAVSNDGKHIFMIGSNVTPIAIDVIEGCGQVANVTLNDSWMIYAPVMNQCPSRNVDPWSFTGNFEIGINPTFSEDNSEVRLAAGSYANYWKAVTLRAGNYSTPRVDYLALGDSYSSGEGELNDDNYITGTNIQHEKCHLSTQSYPFKVSTTQNMSALYTKSVACSGATTADIIGSDDGYLGQGDRFGINELNLSISDLLVRQSDAVGSFMPGIIHQGSFAKTYKPKVMTVGIGGNDVGFADKLVACLMPGTCSWADTADGREKTAVEIKGMFNTLVDTYQKLQSSSPDSKIYAVGYPKLFSTGGQCNALTGFLLNDKERRFVDEGVVYLNQVIAAAAARAGLKYLDVESSFGEYALCGTESENAINAMKLGDDISIINQPGWFELFGQESFHPNALGHTLMAQKITESVDSIMNYDYCNGSISCPSFASVAPEPSSYWISNGYHDLPKQKVTDYVTDISDVIVNGKEKLLKILSGVLAPNSNVNVVIASTPQSLGQFVTADDGSFTANVELPSNLEEGFHTMHVYGTSNSGEAVDLYQVIEYSNPVMAALPDAEPSSETTVIKNENDVTQETESDVKNTSISTPKVSNQIVSSGVQKPSNLASDTILKNGNLAYTPSSTARTQAPAPAPASAQTPAAKETVSKPVPASDKNDVVKENTHNNFDKYSLAAIISALVVISAASLYLFILKR